MKDLATGYEIVARAIQDLRLEAIWAETFASHPETPAEVR